MINTQNIKPINRHIIVRKCVNDHVRGNDGGVLIYKPDEIYETTNWAQVLDVAEDCVVFTKNEIGKFVLCPEMSHEMHRIGAEHESKDFIIREDEIMRQHPYVVEN